MLNLTDVFYDLIDEGYIYDTDEEGYNMSYGEYAAISDYMWECVQDELDNYYGFEEKLNAFKEIADSADDDTCTFWGWNQDNDFYFEINEDEGTYDCGGTLPYILKDDWEEWKSETDLTPSQYAREPEFD